MTPETLLKQLASVPAAAPLIFKTAQGEIRGGYHVTELKLADVNSIDCGARRSSWRELALQLLDGDGGAHMSVEKFQNILVQSAKHVAGLAETPMHVEFAHDNIGMRIYQLTDPVRDGDSVILRLVENHAYCKPARAAAVYQEGNKSDCCKPTRTDDAPSPGAANVASVPCCS